MTRHATRWSRPESNRLPPDCQSGALPDELRPQVGAGRWPRALSPLTAAGPATRPGDEQVDGQTVVVGLVSA